MHSGTSQRVTVFCKQNWDGVRNGPGRCSTYRAAYQACFIKFVKRGEENW
jgi:hypothetical protein